MSTFEQSAAQSIGGAAAESPGGASGFTPGVLTPTLPLQIADRIGDAILEERYAPGERLKEVDLAGAFGVSRASIREALRLLESRGLVRILPQRGAQVTLLSPGELENLFEIRAALLGLSARLAARNFQHSHRQTLQAGLAGLAAAKADASAFARRSAEQVGFVARLSGNTQLVELIDSFAERIGRYARLGLATQERRNQSLAGWRRLVQAIAARDEDAAEQAHRRLALDNRDAALAEIARRAGRAPRTSQDGACVQGRRHGRRLRLRGSRPPAARVAEDSR